MFELLVQFEDMLSGIGLGSVAASTAILLWTKFRYGETLDLRHIFLPASRWDGGLSRGRKWVVRLYRVLVIVALASLLLIIAGELSKKGSL